MIAALRSRSRSSAGARRSSCARARPEARSGFSSGRGQGRPRALADGFVVREWRQMCASSAFSGPAAAAASRARRQQIALGKDLRGVRAIARQAGDGRRHPRRPRCPTGGAGATEAVFGGSPAPAALLDGAGGGCAGRLSRPGSGGGVGFRDALAARWPAGRPPRGLRRVGAIARQAGDGGVTRGAPPGGGHRRGQNSGTVVGGGDRKRRRMLRRWGRRS